MLQKGADDMGLAFVAFLSFVKLYDTWAIIETYGLKFWSVGQ